MNYNAVNAKISGMFGQLLRRSDYEALSRQRSVEEFGTYLKNYPAYRDLLAILGDKSLRRGAIERRIVLSLYKDYSRIYAFIGDYKLREFLDSYFLKHELYVLKVLLCMAYDERDISQEFVNVSSMFPRRLRIDVGKLLSAKNVPELIDGLKNTEFYPVLSRTYDETRSLFELEIQLDLYYYMQLRQNMSRLDKANASIMREISGIEIDLRNIIWTYRLKTYYNMDRNLIYTYLIPAFYKLTRGHLDSLVSAGTAEELVAAMSAGPYGRSFSADSQPEVLYNRESSRLYASARRRHPQSLAAVVSYMYFKELEINNITSLLEGVRYHLNPGDIMKYINHYYGS